MNLESMPGRDRLKGKVALVIGGGSIGEGWGNGKAAAFVYVREGARVAVNGRELGVIHDPEFERTVLATFLGPAPASPRLKLDLLGVK